jgi:hypothetical protein
MERLRHNGAEHLRRSAPHWPWCRLHPAGASRPGQASTAIAPRGGGDRLRPRAGTAIHGVRRPGGRFHPRPLVVGEARGPCRAAPARRRPVRAVDQLLMSSLGGSELGILLGILFRRNPANPSMTPAGLFRNIDDVPTTCRASCRNVLEWGSGGRRFKSGRPDWNGRRRPSFASATEGLLASRSARGEDPGDGEPCGLRAPPRDRMGTHLATEKAQEIRRGVAGSTGPLRSARSRVMEGARW